MSRPILVVLFLAAAALPAIAALAANALPKNVVPHAHLVVRGTVDLLTREVRVLKAYGGAEAPDLLRVENLRSFGPCGGAFLSLKERRELEKKRPTDAILFLVRIDDRAWLVETPSPTWIPPYAAIKYVGKDGKIHGYHQVINPGSVHLIPEKQSLEEFEASIESWLKKRTKSPPVRKTLTGKEREEFWKLVTPLINFPLRKVLTSTPRGKALDKALESLSEFVLGHEGEARDRGIETMLTLAQHKQGPVTPREKAAEKALAKLVGKLSREALEPVLLRELASEDVFSAKDAAGRTLIRIGPESAKAGRDVLVRIVRTREDSSLRTHAYWALRYMGFTEVAEQALKAGGAKEKK